MARAGVFIGVDKTGNLQKLNDAASGAKKMHDWALGQGMVDRTQAKLITDSQGKVSPDLIYDAIKDILDDGPYIDQLIIYFAGHGVNINRNEHWLLTDAPVRANAAVDVSGSVELARYCGVGHVVIISDACRVAPDGIQAQNVRGVDIFPNDSVSDRAKPVDQFFACVLGRTAAEIKDPSVAAQGFCALYTTILLRALLGQESDVLEKSDVAGDDARYVKPVRLESYLERTVPRRVRELNLETKVNQNPDAIITAHPNWISKVERPRRVLRIATPVEEPLPDLRNIAEKVLRTAMVLGPTETANEISKASATKVAGAESFAETAREIAAPFGPDHFETECGLKVRGTTIMQLLMPDGQAELFGPDQVRVRLTRGPATLLLRFDGNIGTVIPMLPRYIAALTFHEGELIDVAYEPSANTYLWSEYVSRSAEIRSLRGVASSASQHGRFRLDRADASIIARKMQYAKGVDPTLAIYAAYAYHDLQEIDRIREMSNYLYEDQGVKLFDLALLGRELTRTEIGRALPIVPFIPLFSQGWPLLRANGVRLHRALAGIERTMRESVWSLFDAEGLLMLERALNSKEVR
jgi:hypothetical protein